MPRKQVAFCQVCGWPLLHIRGWILPDDAYKGDMREPRPRRHDGGYCNQCRKPVEQAVEAKGPPPPSPCPRDGKAILTLDCPNDEYFVFCPTCGQQGPRCRTETEAKCKWTKGERDEVEWQI